MTTKTPSSSSSSSSPLDAIHLSNISLHLPIGNDPFDRPTKPQPISLSLRIHFHSIHRCASTDDVSHTIDYGKLYKQAIAGATAVDPPHANAAALIRWVCAMTVKCLVAQGVRREGLVLEINLTMPKAVKLVESGVSFEGIFRPEAEDAEEKTAKDGSGGEMTVSINGIRCPCVVGVNPHERTNIQTVVVSVSRSYRDGKAPTQDGTDFDREVAGILVVSSPANTVDLDTMLTSHLRT